MLMLLTINSNSRSIEVLTQLSFENISERLFVTVNSIDLHRGIKIEAPHNRKGQFAV